MPIFCSKAGSGWSCYNRCMYTEFWLKALLGLSGAVLAMLYSRRQALIRNAATVSNSLERLKLPAALALMFFIASFVASQNGFFSRAVECDPALPAWLLVCALKLLLLGYLANRTYACIDADFRRISKMLLFIVFLGCTGVELAIIMPAAPFVGPEKFDSHGITLQTLQVTCVPAALTSICRLYGEATNEYETVKKVKTLLIGSLTGHSVAGCRNLGFTEAAYSSKDFAAMLEENLPFLITVDVGIYNVEHAIAVIGWKSSDTTLYLADPLRGLVTVNYDNFSKSWGGRIIRLGKRHGSASAPLLSEFATNF
ncbi:MAG TPA: cysteine peptidase family C39 domain-containing protein [Candidatus Rifleibacterium sp.]|nr:cysteine peptidase family C39 domain-containing protein [Candidatus Rifleibacterium sp.]